jgi:hypothetical protein
MVFFPMLKKECIEGERSTLGSVMRSWETRAFGLYGSGLNGPMGHRKWRSKLVSCTKCDVYCLAGNQALQKKFGSNASVLMDDTIRGKQQYKM